MQVKDVIQRDGIIIETLTSQGIPTGNVYKLTGIILQDGKTYAWKQYRQGKTKLHPNVSCRILDNRPYHGMYGPF